MYKEQKEQKPSIDSLIEQHLSGSLKEDAILLVAFLRENKMSPQWGATNSFNVSHKNRRVCILKITDNCFEIRVSSQYDAQFNACFLQECEEIRQFLLQNITICFGCGSCKPGQDIEILGHRVTNACFNPVIRMSNPSRVQLDCAKKLVLLRKRAIAQGTAPKITYIAMDKREA